MIHQRKKINYKNKIFEQKIRSPVTTASAAASPPRSILAWAMGSGLALAEEAAAAAAGASFAAAFFLSEETDLDTETELTVHCFGDAALVA